MGYIRFSVYFPVKFLNFQQIFPFMCSFLWSLVYFSSTDPLWSQTLLLKFTNPIVKSRGCSKITATPDWKFKPNTKHIIWKGTTRTSENKLFDETNASSPFWFISRLKLFYMLTLFQHLTENLNFFTKQLSPNYILNASFSLYRSLKYVQYEFFGALVSHPKEKPIIWNLKIV